MGDKDSAARQPHVAPVASLITSAEPNGQHASPARQGPNVGGTDATVQFIMMNTKKVINKDMVTEKAGQNVQNPFIRAYER